MAGPNGAVRTTMLFSAASEIMANTGRSGRTMAPGKAASLMAALLGIIESPLIAAEIEAATLDPKKAIASAQQLLDEHFQTVADAIARSQRVEADVVAHAIAKARQPSSTKDQDRGPFSWDVA